MQLKFLTLPNVRLSANLFEETHIIFQLEKKHIHIICTKHNLSTLYYSSLTEKKPCFTWDLYNCIHSHFTETAYTTLSRQLKRYLFYKWIIITNEEMKTRQDICKMFHQKQCSFKLSSIGSNDTKWTRNRTQTITFTPTHFRRLIKMSHHALNFRNFNHLLSWLISFCRF